MKLAEPGAGEADYNFHVRRSVSMVWDESVPGCLRLPTRRERVTLWLGDRWHSATRWFRPRTVTSAVDVEAGCITLATERWSWLRWRWERM